MQRHTLIERPDHISPRELDDYLAAGWYRIGQTMMTCRFLVFEETLRSTIWTRLDLRAHSMRKGQRRHLRRLRREITIRSGPVRIDATRERLYQRYRSVARGDRSPTLHDFLYEGRHTSLFDTRELSLWRGEELVAFCWFDVGENSLQSLLGAYEPSEAALGLGYATLLLELEWGQEHGYAFHYSGYVMPDEPAMDYKLRAGQMEFLSQEGQWLPWEDFGPQHDPLIVLTEHLTIARDAMLLRGLPAEIIDYKMFEARAYEPGLHRCYEQPRAIESSRSQHGNSTLLVSYNLDTDRYTAIHAVRAAGFVRPPDPASPPRRVTLFVEHEAVISDQTADQLADALHARLTGNQRW